MTTIILKHGAYDTLQSNRLEEYEHKKNTTMKNVSHKKVWNLGMTQAHMEPPQTPLITGTYDSKSENIFKSRNCVEILRLVHRNSTSVGCLCLTIGIRNSLFYLCKTSA